jgi:hypothetical protein
VTEEEVVVTKHPTEDDPQAVLTVKVEPNAGLEEHFCFLILEITLRRCPIDEHTYRILKPECDQITPESLDTIEELMFFWPLNQLMPYEVIDRLKDELFEYNRDTKGFHKARLREQQERLKKEAEIELAKEQARKARAN